MDKIKKKIQLFEGINKQLRQPGLDDKVLRVKRNTQSRVAHLSLHFTEEIYTAVCITRV